MKTLWIWVYEHFFTRPSSVAMNHYSHTRFFVKLLLDILALIGLIFTIFVIWFLDIALTTMDEASLDYWYTISYILFLGVYTNFCLFKYYRFYYNVYFIHITLLTLSIILLISYF